MASNSKEFNQELVRLYLEELGYLPAFELTCPPESASEKTGNRSDLEIDVLAVQVVGGEVETAIIGVIKGYWTGSSALSPSMVRHLEGKKKTFSRSFAEHRLRFVRQRFGLGTAPIKKVLFFSVHSPQKALEAESLLRLEGIEVVYLERIIADLIPRMSKEPHLASSAALQTVRALKGSRIFSERKISEEKRPKLKKKPSGKSAEEPEPQLTLFPGPEVNRR